MISRIAAFYFFYFAAVAVYIIFMPKILQTIGYSPFEIGVIFAAAPLSRFLAPFLFLRLIPHNRFVFLTALASSFILSLLIYQALYHFELMIVLMVLMGFFWSIQLPYVEVLALEKIKKEQYGKARLFGSIGFTIVALWIGQIPFTIHFSMNMYVGTIFFTLIFGAILSQFIDKNESKKEQVQHFSFSHAELWIGLFLVQVGFGGFYNFFTIFEGEHHIPLDTITYLWAFGVIAEIIMFMFQQRFLHINLLTLMKLSIFLTIIRWLMLDLFPDSLVMLYASQSLHAFSLALLHTVSITYIFSLYSQYKKLAQQFYLGITFGLGMFIGSLLSGSLYGEHLFFYMAIVTAVAYLFIILHHRKMKQLKTS
jgi:MFS transporter, PPP family, 3-phenylpropionic acid transporter